MSVSAHDHDHPDERELTILYATETGNAQDVAERIARLCQRLHFAVRLYSVDEYQVVCPSVSKNSEHLTYLLSGRHLLGASDYLYYLDDGFRPRAALDDQLLDITSSCRPPARSLRPP